jgi:cytochrome c peroxidase
MRFVSSFLISAFCIIVLISLRNPSSGSIGYEATVAYYKLKSDEFAASTIRLQSSIANIRNNDSSSIRDARNALAVCRLNYKSIEFFLEYFFKSFAIFFNGPNKFEVEEPYMEWQSPIGLQVIETLLFQENVETVKEELLQQIDAVNSSASDLKALLYGFKADDKQLLESFRLELIRIYTLGITGFDAPSLKTGITESYVALTGVEHALRPFLKENTSHADSVSYYLNSSLKYLNKKADFNSFSRLEFLVQYGLPLQKQLSLLINEMHLIHNSTNNILNYEAENVFSPDAININAFPNAGVVPNSSLIELGKKLFFETALSGNNKTSCATCHNPEKHFSDGLSKSLAFNGHSNVSRNAPTLLYSGFQFQQFWEGRARDLEEQVATVMSSPQEMNSNYTTASKYLSIQKEYKNLFQQSFPTTKDSIITLATISQSIAAFVRTLNPRNSPFDKYMQGDKNALNESEQHGFNLFMGKAQCATCHFAPLFNGLVPPLYNLSELEILGTPKTDNFAKPESDTDRGRYNIFPIAFYEKAFKTPTVRNVSATAPYMHNGSFRSLDKVVEFYNKGGGKGLGLDVKNQTLSADSLHLTNTEIKDIVSFMQSLEDKILF